MVRKAGAWEIFYHVLMRLILVAYFCVGFHIFIYFQGQTDPKKTKEDAGIIVQLLSYFLGTLLLLSFPVTLLNIFGLFFLNPFCSPPKQQLGDTLPFICFRVVTRGLYPKLVKDTTYQNIEICRRAGLKNFKFEIVTDKTVSIGKHQDIRETVVPNKYKTKNNALFKARALHWCLEQNVNILSNEDWIVHLDEETKLTDDVIYGISGFIAKSEADIGQGVIVYGDDVIENWFTTLADGLRVAFDYGFMRFALQVFKRPILGLKGSFIVTKVKTEMDVGFDFGPKQSIAEDLMFALTAWYKGYKFDFVQGTMVEKSTFTFLDFIKQRKRWFIGHLHVLWGSSIPLYCKIVLLPMNIVNLFLWAQILISFAAFFYPLIYLGDFIYIIPIIVPAVLFSYVFGNFMSFRRRRFGILQRLLLATLSQLLVHIAGVLEAIAMLWGFFTRNSLTFHIVQKQASVPLTGSDNV